MQGVMLIKQGNCVFGVMEFCIFVVFKNNQTYTDGRTTGSNCAN